MREHFKEYPQDLESLLAWGHAEVADGEGSAFCRGRRPIDSYNNPIYFEVRGDHFVLVSLGSDGQVDTDPWQVREGQFTWKGVDLSRAPFTICGRPKTDTVYSDRGFHRGCLVK